MKSVHTAIARRRLRSAIDDFEKAAGRDPSVRELMEALGGVKDNLGEGADGKSVPTPGRRAALAAAEGGPTDFKGARQEMAESPTE